MKKIFAMVAVAAGLLFAGNANAQLGVNIGYAPQTYTRTVTSGSNTNTTTTNMSGFFAGVNYNLNLTGDLNVSLGAQFRYNTSKDTLVNANVGSLAGAKSENTNTQSMIDIPILFNYGFNLNSALKLSVFVGPTISYALAGNTHTTTTVTVLGSNSVTESDSDWYGDNSNRKKLDVAATIGLNVQYNQFRLFGGYNMGLLNLTSADNTTLKASNIFIGVGMAL